MADLSIPTTAALSEELAPAPVLLEAWAVVEQAEAAARNAATARPRLPARPAAADAPLPAPRARYSFD